MADFTGQNIQDTYQRVVQIDNGQLQDGTGSALVSLDVTASHAISASHEITFELSSSHAETADFLTPGNDINVRHVTASGNISSSGTITANEYILPFNKLFRAIDSTGAEQNIINNFAIGAITFGDDDSGTHIDGKSVVISSPSLDTTGHITASGNISSSGTITGIINGGTF
jgi:hypothetical protein